MKELDSTQTTSSYACEQADRGSAVHAPATNHIASSSPPLPLLYVCLARSVSMTMLAQWGNLDRGESV